MSTEDLLTWWDDNRADLPWRRSPTPYRVWISEVMLQQTVVKAVIDHFQRWMQRWPTVTDLADATEQQVTRVWEGLGYYSRARNILAASRQMVQRFEGRVPDRYHDLLSLPGIGDYTARAILSIAFSLPYYLIDANVKRVLQRRHAWPDWNRQAQLRGAEELERLLPESRPGDFNQAMMELGQKICTTKRPVCPICPLAAGCETRRQGLQGEIPRRRKHRVVQRESRVIVLLKHETVWLCRPGNRLFAGLWTFPRVDLNASLASLPSGHLKRRTHTYTRYRERLLPEIHRVDQIPYRETELCDHGGDWLSLGVVMEVPMPSAHRLIARDLAAYLAQDVPLM